jgi:transcriptional regulator GlxA family with amidase domain
MKLAYVLYDNFTMLDIVGPYNVLTLLHQHEHVWVGENAGLVADHTRCGGLTADVTFDELQKPDIVIVPGGFQTEKHLTGPVVEWLRNVHPTTVWTTSVCTGSLLLGAAGILQGLEATSHWAALESLKEFGAIPATRRVIEHPEARVVTAAGVSSGIDMALALIATLESELHAQAVQLAIEYDPAPPTDTGSPGKATPEIIQKALELLGAASA